jgi:hypothetical protein
MQTWQGVKGDREGGVSILPAHRKPSSRPPAVTVDKPWERGGRGRQGGPS